MIVTNKLDRGDSVNDYPSTKIRSNLLERRKAKKMLGNRK